MNKVYIIESQSWEDDTHEFDFSLEDYTFYTTKEKAIKVRDEENSKVVLRCLKHQKTWSIDSYTKEDIEKLIDQWQKDRENELDEGSKITELMMTFEYIDFYYVSELVLDKR